MDYSIIVSNAVPAVEVTIISNIYVVTNHSAAPQIPAETTKEATTETTIKAATEAVMDYSTFSDMPVEVIILNIGY
jgi:hypothetical protein